MLAALVAAAVAATAPLPAAPTRWVTDTAGFMSEPARAALDAKLEGYERATGHQVVVWVGKTIGDADLADWAVRTFAAWKVGRKGLDDGIAMFVLADDRNVESKQTIELPVSFLQSVGDAVGLSIEVDKLREACRSPERDEASHPGT